MKTNLISNLIPSFALFLTLSVNGANASANPGMLHSSGTGTAQEVKTNLIERKGSIVNIAEEPPILRAMLSDRTGKYQFQSKEDLGKEMFAYTFIGPKGKPVLIFKTPNDRLVFGDLINIDGTNHNDFLLVKNGLVESDTKKFAKLADSFYFEMNPGKDKVVYALFDANCGYCKKLYKELSYGELKVTVRWIPVAYLSSTSGTKIDAAINTGAGGFELLMQNKLLPSDSVSEKNQSNLDSNKLIMSKHNIMGAPAVLHMNNGKFEVISGLPNKATINSVFR